jgi:hypothetical protein
VALHMQLYAIKGLEDLTEHGQQAAMNSIYSWWYLTPAAGN